MSDKIILLIEDSPSDELVTKRAFHKNNIVNEVVVACDGIEAVDYLRGNGKHAGSLSPSLIVLDLNLPKVGGLDVLEIIRSNAKTKHTPVVVMTSCEDEQALRRAYELGANSFIKKPTDVCEFEDTILTLGMYWLLLNRHPSCCD